MGGVSFGCDGGLRVTNRRSRSQVRNPILAPSSFIWNPNLLFCQDTLGTNATKPVFKRRIVQAAEFARRSVATCHIGFEVAGARRRQVEKHCGEESQGASIERSTGRGCAVMNF